jgi:hypothetical protein
MTTGSQAADPFMRYATRNHAFVPATTWVLEDASLRLEDEKGPPRVIPLGRIKAIRLDFAPSRPERNRFRCRLTVHQTETLTFYNRTYVGYYNFAETSAEYVAFVTALVAALRRHAPACRFLAGATGISYFFNVLTTAFIFVCFAAISWFLFRVGLTWMLAIKILILIFFVPTLIYWGVRNRPRSFSPVAIPPDVLPAPAPVPPTKP